MSSSEQKVKCPRCGSDEIADHIQTVVTSPGINVHSVGWRCTKCQQIWGHEGFVDKVTTGIATKMLKTKPGFCVICGSEILDKGRIVCLGCGAPTIITGPGLERTVAVGVLTLFDAKSDCCGKDVQITAKLTCKESCHQEFVKQMENQFGVIKKIIDAESGIAYRVPTRDIIEKGITYVDVQKYPKWEQK